MWQSKLTYQLERFGLVLVWLAFIALFGFMRPDTFLTWSNFSTIFGSEAVLVIVTLGLIIPLTAGDFDLSIAQVLTLVSMSTAILDARLDVPLIIVLPIVFAIGALIGLINGFIILYFRVHSLIVTLGGRHLSAWCHAVDRKFADDFWRVPGVDGVGHHPAPMGHSYCVLLRHAAGCDDLVYAELHGLRTTSSFYWPWA